MEDSRLIWLLKAIMLLGIALILLGVYLHNFSEAIAQLGVTGIIISALCVAIGVALSLPTKMYLTFVLVRREERARQSPDKPRDAL
ncbi:hypothetical protein JYB88_01740 [Shewanella cyperi]|uniref:Uncharacterized protein n=1 Tax=Shewanella cyperi TaxID=2814292 RepID=A0A975AMR9_9GAMM|nr:hypothetical protein [Shewanella cyperi]QSX31742.1 hypothetical protein JYB88_01740 [Shewanella cyperi]